MSFDIERKVTPENLLDILKTDVGDPHSRLLRLQRWAEKHCAPAPAPESGEKGKKSSKKAA